MKTILILSLVCLTFSVWGPVDKIKNSQTDDVCDPYYTDPDSLSDCVDLNLKVTENGKTHYADRCCFIRFQYYGKSTKSCVPLTEELYMDITDTIRKLEDDCTKNLYEDSNIEGGRCKIYQLDCAASNIKFLSFAILMLALLF